MAFSTRHAGGLGRSCGLGRTGVMVCRQPKSNGEPITLTAEWALTLEALQEGVANEEAWPNWTDTTSSGFEVLSSTPMDTLAARLETGADVILRQSWMLTSWDSGFVVMAPERVGPHETEPLLIRVITPLLEESAQPKPPADIFAEQWTCGNDFDGWSVLVGLLALFAVLSKLCVGGTIAP